MAWTVGPLGGSLGGWAGVLAGQGCPFVLSSCSVEYLSRSGVWAMGVGQGLRTWDSGNS